MMLEYELKFVVPSYRVAPIIEFVSLTCNNDPLYPAGIVSSIYYDSRNLDSVNEKINSDYLKTKYRLRWYTDPDTGGFSEFSFAESKHRIGCRRVKTRTTTAFPPEQLEGFSLDDARLLEIPLVMRQSGIRASADLLPSLLIRYTRHRYIEPVTGARVSIDVDITTPRINRYILPRGTPSALSNAVIEVKGERDSLPFVLKPLIKQGIRKASFSKYLACYAKSLQLEFLPL
jgi:hypothetical protein